ncbi:MBL fold metallo-hydrolase [Vacuolonema iberomarrocanum]|uniref:MBL fold metallo-hydrolase n=1 Tax=Vacuolonema iberomarrocanum TaxID=3454632 RepID=UPI0019F80EF5|nr:MBL fold metallo-hydrolase [filamentous cyanobacterium LEGE 07170]
MAASPSDFDRIKPPAPGSGKPPRSVVDGIFAFPPNRDILGGTAYFIADSDGNILVDCPAWDETHRDFLHMQGGIRWLVLTHRGAIAHVRELQDAFDCEIVIQEQESYLLPGTTVTTFHQDFTLTAHSRILWTPGHTPGSSCVYHQYQGGVLFSGRHLVPDRQGNPVPLRASKTFHWFRQLRSVERLRQEFSPDTLRWICPGANTGFLRGRRAIDGAYEKLAALDLDAMRSLQPTL